MTWIIHPALGNVLVQPLQDEDVTNSGIILVSHIEKETHIAEVIAVCDPYEATAGDRTLAKAGPIYAPGQLVIIGKYNGREVKIRNDPAKPHEKYIIIRETDVLGLLEEGTYEQLNSRSTAGTDRAGAGDQSVGGPLYLGGALFGENPGLRSFNDPT